MKQEGFVRQNDHQQQRVAGRLEDVMRNQGKGSKKVEVAGAK